MERKSSLSPTRGDNNFPMQESPVSRPLTRSSSCAKWELDWRDPDAMLKISVYDDSHAKKKKGAPQVLRERISRMEQAMTQFSPTGRRRFRSSSLSKKSQKHLVLFRSMVSSVILLRRCFRMRKKFAVQSKNMILTHMERSDSIETFKTCSVSRELRMILSTPPEYRRPEEVRKVQFYLRASGASRLLAGASTPEEMENLSRHVAYERYENDRVVAQQGRSPDRFYFIITGKLLIVKEYHIDTGIISKTVGMLTKGMTTEVEEMEQRTPRKESLICRGTVEALVLDRDDYFFIHGERGGAPREFLSRHSLFRSFPFNSVGGHKQMIRLQYFPKGAVIFGGGEEFEFIYAIKSGECSLIRVQLVADLRSHKWSMFNKRSVQELGCTRSKRSQSAAERSAEFRMWKGPSRTPAGYKRNCFTAPNPSISSAPASRQQPKSGVGPKTPVYESGFGPRRDLGISPSFSAKKASREGFHEVIKEEEENEHPKEISKRDDLTLPRINISSSESQTRPPDSMTTSSELTTVRQQIATELGGPQRNLLKPMLSKSRLSAQPLHTTRDSTPGQPAIKRKTETIRSAPPTLRRAYLELGKLKPGDVLGLEDTVGQMEDLPHIRLISDSGAEVVLINRKFFLRNAPASLLSRISYETNSYPSIAKARVALETQEAWDMYKSSLMRIIATKDTLLQNSKPHSPISKQTRDRRKTGTDKVDFVTPRLIPPGTANKPRNDRSSSSTKIYRHWPKLYKDVPSRLVKSENSHRLPRRLSTGQGLRHLKGVQVTLMQNKQPV